MLKTMGKNILILQLWLIAFTKLIMAADDCSNYDVVFPLEPNLGAAIYEPAFERGVLEEFTVCYRMRPSDNSITPFSYAVHENNNELLIELMPEILVVWVADNDLVLPYKESFELNKWVHHCVTFESKSGLLELFKNGKSEAWVRTPSGRKVRPNGIIVLGQDQDSYGGGFEKDSSMRGRLSDVQIWDRILSQTQVAQLADGQGKEGNLLAWSNFRSKWRIQGGAEIEDEEC